MHGSDGDQHVEKHTRKSQVQYASSHLETLDAANNNPALSSLL